MSYDAFMSKTVPGPKGLPFIGSIFSIRKDPLHFFLEVQKKYGDVVYLKLGFFNVYLVSHPEGIKHVLQDHRQNYHKSLLYDRMKPVLGEGLLTSEDHLWQRQRRLTQPAFHHQKIGKMTDIMIAETNKMLEEWKSALAGGTSLDIQAEIMQLTSRIIVRTMFGSQLENTSGGAGGKAPIKSTVEEAWNVVNEWIGSRHWALTEWSGRLPTPKNLRFRQNLLFLEEFLKQMVGQRRHSGEAHEDLLSMLLESCDEETGEKMSDKQLRDEMMTIFLAGHETTSLALGWTCYLLANHVPVFEKLRREIDEVLEERVPSFNEVPRLKYVRMVLEESMRLYPPAWGIGRRALADDRVGGYGIPAGSLVFLLQYVTHRREDLWEDPEKFDPERFSPDKVKERHRFAYFPFGGGPRICIGNAFAMTEAIILLTMICQKFRFVPVDQPPVAMDPQLTLRSKNGIWLKVKSARE